MRVRFLGPIDRVTGSCAWLADDDLNIQLLVDCGLIQGEADTAGWNEGEFPFDPSKLKTVLLTHAHVDHCGMLPMLYRRGFTGNVIATIETAHLAKRALTDAAKLPGCHYDKKDVELVRFHEPAGDRALMGVAPIHPDVFVSFYRTNHMVGAVSVRVLWGAPEGLQRSITFSGDLGANEEDQEHQPLNRHRMHPWSSDYAVIESTYGGHCRPEAERDHEARLGRLRAELERLVANKGVLVIPAFAMDRTQAVLLDLTEILRRDRLGEARFKGVGVVLHGPLAAGAGNVYAHSMKRKVSSHNKKLRPYWLSKAMFRILGLDHRNGDHERAVELYLHGIFASEARPTSPDETALLDQLIPGPRRLHDVWAGKTEFPLGEGPVVLLTGGGMCDGGPIRGYFRQLLPRPDVTIAFSGYLGSASFGAELARIGELSPDDRQRLSEHLRWEQRGEEQSIAMRDVRARMVRLSGYSAHADQPSLVRWVFGEFKGKNSLAGRKVFIQHGVATARRELAAALNHRAAEVAPGLGFEAILPGTDRWFDLDTGTWLGGEPRSRSDLERENDELRQELEAFRRQKR